jgi:hypothetical protein
MRKISREVVFESGDAQWSGDPNLKRTGILLAHIKEKHTEDGHINSVKSMIGFRKLDETDQIKRCKAFFPPIIDGKNIIAAIEKNRCPFCEIEQARIIENICRSNRDSGRGSFHAPEGSGYRYHIDNDGRLLRERTSTAANREWFDFKKGFWFPDQDSPALLKTDSSP